MHITQYDYRGGLANFVSLIMLLAQYSDAIFLVAAIILVEAISNNNKCIVFFTKKVWTLWLFKEIYGESVSFHIKGQAEYRFECSIKQKEFHCCRFFSFAWLVVIL